MSGRPARRAGLVALVLVGLAVLSGVPAAARPGGRPRQAPAQASPSVVLVDQPGWVRPGEPYTVGLRVTDPPAGATIDMVVHDPVRSRADFRDSLDGELGGTEHPVPAVPVTGPGPVDIGFTPSTDGGDLSGRGVYPVEIRLRSADETVDSLVTYLSYLNESPSDWPPLEVGVLVDIAAPPALQPDGTTELSSETVALARQRIQAVEAAGPTPVTLAPLPGTVEGLAEAGGGDAALVDQLRDLAVSHQVLARPFVDIDLASLQDAGLDSEAYAQSDAGANVSRARLAVEPAGGVWLSGETWRPEGAQRAAAIGFDRAIVPPTAVADGDEVVPTTPVRVGDDGPLAMVTDSGLAAHLTSDDGMVAAHRFLAELTITWLEAPSDQRAVVVHLPPDEEIEPQVVGTALAALSDGQAVRGVPVTQIFTDVAVSEDGPTSVDLAPAERGPDLRSLAPRIESVRGRVAGVAGVLDDASVGASIEHSLLMSTGVDTPQGDRAAYVDRADAALGDVAGAVTLQDEFRITLTARSSTIPVTVTNNGDRNLHVRVQLDSDQLEFPDGDVLTPTLPPGTTRLEVDVRTRTSGAFTLVVTVSSPDGSVVLDRSTFDIRSTAISGVGLLLSVGAGLFLAVWWGRHWYRTRRARREGAPEPSPTGPRGDRAPEPARAVRERSTGSLAPWAAPAPRSPAPTTPPPPAPPPPAPPVAEPPPPAPTDDAPYRPAHMARSRGRGGSHRA